MKTLLAIVLLATTAFAQQKTPPPPGAARPLNLPKITEKKLANGLTVVLAPLPNVPKVSAVLTFRSATTATDRDAHPGIAQIAAAVANEGTDSRTSPLGPAVLVTGAARLPGPSTFGLGWPG